MSPGNVCALVSLPKRDFVAKTTMDTKFQQLFQLYSLWLGVWEQSHGYNIYSTHKEVYLEE